MLTVPLNSIPTDQSKLFLFQCHNVQRRFPSLLQRHQKKKLPRTGNNFFLDNVVTLQQRMNFVVKYGSGWGWSKEKLRHFNVVLNNHDVATNSCSGFVLAGEEWTFALFYHNLNNDFVSALFWVTSGRCHKARNSCAEIAVIAVVWTEVKIHEWGRNIPSTIMETTRVIPLNAFRII